MVRSRGLSISRGHPLPLGASFRRQGVNFAVYSGHATAVTLVLFEPGGREALACWPLDPRYNRTGNVWHALVTGIGPGVEYAFRADMKPNPRPAVHRFDPDLLLLDPYARAVSGAPSWGGPPGLRPRRARVEGEEFDWGFDHPLNHHLADSIIYEVHVRGFTAHRSSGVSQPGTYRGLIEKIPYLQELGVTAVELLPVTEFEETDHRRVNPLTGQPLLNFWGYQPLAFFAPKAGYAASGPEGGEVHEFREMVKALHQAGIEVILDMVFNHTGEGEEDGPVVSFRGLDNATYYLMDRQTGKYLDFSACGNTLNCNHPVVRTLILSCLRYWVTEMHVDGFRFDLASILGRDSDGRALESPPLLEIIAADPALAHTKLIAEAWDAAGLYQVGSFPNFGRWAEWNGRFRDEVRRFVRGDAGSVPALATRLSGSADLYQHDGRAPFHSVNFVTSHDGFTLADLVAYNDRHNEANGEDGKDGQADNLSWNCGEEGPTRSPELADLRLRQRKNYAAILLLSQGVPMILAGDEMGKSQGGNNNAYNQDNEISWLDWGRKDAEGELFRFFCRLIAFRKAHPGLRRRSFAEEPPGRPWVTWHGSRRGQPDWSPAARSLGMHLLSNGQDDDIFVMPSAHERACRVELPELPGSRRWRRAFDTGLPSPQDAAEVGQEAVLEDQTGYPVGPRSVVVLVGR
ncbi:MAG TPA: isoamylase [Vicinamibacteria bacterium]|nr:isoamylase [Vicinamibacteria bacterium]